MAEKRGYVEIGETGPRKTRVAWSKLDRLNPNPDEGGRDSNSETFR